MGFRHSIAQHFRCEPAKKVHDFRFFILLNFFLSDSILIKISYCRIFSQVSHPSSRYSSTGFRKALSLFEELYMYQKNLKPILDNNAGVVGYCSPFTLWSNICDVVTDKAGSDTKISRCLEQDRPSIIEMQLRLPTRLCRNAGQIKSLKTRNQKTGSQHTLRSFMSSLGRKHAHSKPATVSQISSYFCFELINNRPLEIMSQSHSGTTH